MQGKRESKSADYAAYYVSTARCDKFNLKKQISKLLGLNEIPFLYSPNCCAFQPANVCFACIGQTIGIF